MSDGMKRAGGRTLLVDRAGGESRRVRGHLHSHSLCSLPAAPSVGFLWSSPPGTCTIHTLSVNTASEGPLLGTGRLEFPPTLLQVVRSDDSMQLVVGITAERCHSDLLLHVIDLTLILQIQKILFA